MRIFVLVLLLVGACKKQQKPEAPVAENNTLGCEEIPSTYPDVDRKRISQCGRQHRPVTVIAPGLRVSETRWVNRHQNQKTRGRTITPVSRGRTRGPQKSNRPTRSSQTRSPMGGMRSPR